METTLQNLNFLTDFLGPDERKLAQRSPPAKENLAPGPNPCPKVRVLGDPLVHFKGSNLENLSEVTRLYRQDGQALVFAGFDRTMPVDSVHVHAFTS